MNSTTEERIFLDHAATTPLSPQAAAAMAAIESGGALNPSSLHAEGRRARALLDDARSQVASAIGASAAEIVFTSGGSEADGQALLGVACAATDEQRRGIVVSAIEHKAVLETVDALREEGRRVEVVPVDPQGRIDLERFEALLGDDTLVASVMYANNEIGTVEPIARLAEIAHRHGALLHTDAIQAPNWLRIDVAALGVDLLSLSAHKCYGPKGNGALYVRAGTPIAPLLRGGGQESGLRAGTQNLAGIVGFATALGVAVRDRRDNAARVGALRDALEAGLLAGIPGAWVNAAGALRLPNLASVGFPGTDPQALPVQFDLAGVAVSAGSACTSGVPEPSHVLAAIGCDPAQRGGVVRFSLGIATTAAQIDRTAGIAREIASRTGI